MKLTKEDFAILDKFKFEIPPVGIKYLFTKPPKDIPKLEKKLNICEMPAEAAKGHAFWVSMHEFSCVAPLILGMLEREAGYEAGLMGPKYEIYEEPRANKKLYQYAPRLPHGSVNYVLFAPLSKMTFNPDILFVHANGQQAKILMRASGYSNTKIWNSKCAAALTCSFMFVQPYLTGEIYYVVTPVGMGGKSYPDGVYLISYPYETLRDLLWSLKEMNWVPNWDTMTADELRVEIDRLNKEIEEETGQKIQIQGQ